MGEGGENKKCQMVTPIFKLFKSQTKWCAKNIFNVPIEDDNLKHEWILTQNNSYQSYGLCF